MAKSKKNEDDSIYSDEQRQLYRNRLEDLKAERFIIERDLQK